MILQVLSLYPSKAPNQHRSSRLKEITALVLVFSLWLSSLVMANPRSRETARGLPAPDATRLLTEADAQASRKDNGPAVGLLHAPLSQVSANSLLAAFASSTPPAANGIAVVRHAPTLNGNGRVEGSLRQLTGESVILNGAVITNDLQVPGTPTVLLNGNPTFGGTIQGTGSSQPTNYQVTLNGASTLGHLVTRNDPITLTNVSSPPASQGTRSVTINSAGQSAGDFTTLRDLTLNGNVGMYAIPPGTYRNFIANSGSGFVLGISGSTQSATYNLSTLTLNGQGQIQVAGPVNLTLASGFTLNASMGQSSQPSWLTVQVASGGVTLNGGSSLYAVVKAPAGTVTINFNSQLIGTVACDRLTINAGGLLRLTESALPPVNQPPVVNAGQTQTVSLPNSASLNGSVSDDGLPAGSTVTVAWSKVSGPGNVTFANSSNVVTSAAFSLAGTYVLRLTASDSQLTSSSDVTVTVNPQNQPPVVNAGPDRTITLPSTAALSGTATDDGLPTGSVLTATWSKVSGPGAVTFGNANAPATSASFSVAGTYTLRLTASDSQLSRSDDAVVTVNPQNQPPVVNAGPDRTVTLPSTATLSGTATDDGQPTGSVLSATWSKVSGPGAVTFGNANAPATSASFGVAGTYTLRLTASDSQLSTSDDVVVTVNPQNQPPTANAGPDQTVTLPAAANLNGSVSDDGLPAGSTVTTTWTKVSGPGAVTFGNPNVTVTTASFSVAGTYTLRLTASDSQLSASDDVVLTVNPQNQPPVANAGPDQTITLPATATLSGTATDDGLPTGSVLSVTWTKVSGPGAVSFGNANIPATSASFSVAGTYTLRLTANDSQLSTSDDVVVTVNPQNQPPTANAGPDQTVTLPAAANLNGSVSDDGLPAGSSITITWTKVSGPGAVTFGNPNVTVTTASFSVAGTYTLRLTASDSLLSAIDDVVMTVNPQNQPPVANAGPDQAITLPATATLNGTATDDGLPTGSVLTATWSKVSGPGAVTFGNANAPATTASFSVAGTYALRLTVSDTQLSTSDDVIVTVNPQNQPPTANAGPDQTVTLPAAANLNGSVSDDGYPAGSTVTTVWSVVSGPGSVTFGSAIVTVTSASFSAPGTYVLRLTASDSALSSSDDVTVSVNAPGNQAPSVNAGPDQTVFLPDRNVGFFLNDLAGFNAAAGTPPVVVDFENIASGTEITGVTLSGVTFELGNSPAPSAPLIVTRGADTFTAYGFSGIIDASTNKLIPTSGENVLSPGGSELAPGPNPMLENDDLRISFPEPVSAIGFDILFQELDFGSGVGVTILDSSGNVLYDNSVLPDGSGQGGGAPGGSIFVGFVSTRANIATIIIDEYDDNNAFPDANIGFDTFRVRRLIPTTAFMNLSGAVADDGLPSGGSLTSSWSKVSGPGSVTFDDSRQAVTRASFSDSGSYTLRLTASDSELTSNDDLSVTVNEGAINYPPAVNAGADQTIVLPANSLTLSATVSDDGQPAGSVVTVGWSVLGGPGNVTFSNPNAAATTVTLSTPGTYVLRVSASDSQLTTGDDVVITLIDPAAANQPPSVNAGPDQTISQLNAANLGGTVRDDGLPLGGGIMISWSKVSGPGLVSFANTNQASTTARFSSAGFYVLRLTASDSALTASDDITITVASAGNQVPAVNAGPDQVGTWPETGNAKSFLMDLNGKETKRLTFSLFDDYPANWSPQNNRIVFNSNRDGNNEIYVMDADGKNQTRLTYSAAYEFGPDWSPDGTKILYTSNEFGANDVFAMDADGTNKRRLTTNAASDRGGVWRPRIINGQVTNGDEIVFTSFRDGNLELYAMDPDGSNQRRLTSNAGQDEAAVWLPGGSALAFSSRRDGGADLDIYLMDPDGSNVRRVLSNPGDDFLSDWSHDGTKLAWINTNGSNTDVYTANADGSQIKRLTDFPGEDAAAYFSPDDTQLVLSSRRDGVYLNGSAADDGLPANTLTIAWSRVAGPGNVTFDNPNTATTRATFDAPGTYVLRLTANDSVATSRDEVTVVINPAKQPPTVDAGPDQTVQQSAGARLHGVVSEDGLPAQHGVNVTWSKASGPGDVTFSNANSAFTDAAFSMPGSYVLQLTGNDGGFLVSDVLTVTVIGGNQPPAANAGPDQTVAINGNLIANAGNEEQLISGEISGWAEVQGTSWTQGTSNSGSGFPSAQRGSNFFFAGDAAQAELRQDVDVSAFAGTIAAGTQQFEFRAYVRSAVEAVPDSARVIVEYRDAADTNVIATLDSGEIAATNVWHLTEVTQITPAGTGWIRVRLLGTRNSGVTNDAFFDSLSLRPVGNAAVKLNGVVTDDGLPSGSSVSATWTTVSGPGTVVFANTNAANSGAVFTAPGAYVLRLTASDGQLSASDDVSVTVYPANQPPVVNAGANQTITLPATAALNGTATDDGQPPGSTLSETWIKAAGPGNVSFANANSATTTASFSQGGLYLLRLTADDSEFSASSDVSITVNAQTGNQPPVVNAGADQTLTLPSDILTLNGSATDDGQPAGSTLQVRGMRSVDLPRWSLAVRIARSQPSASARQEATSCGSTPAMAS